MARIQNRARLTDHGERELRATVLEPGRGGPGRAEPVGRPAPVRRRCTADHLVAGGRSYDLSAVDRLVVLGAGKASAEVAAALEQMLGPRLDGGIVVVPPDAPAAHARG